MLHRYLLASFTAVLTLTVSAQKQCHPYLDQDGLECVMTWNSGSGASELFYYSADNQAFTASPYQLVAKPTGDAGVYQFSPYLDQDGLECVLAWNATTGSSKLFYYSADTKSFTEAPYQLPANPTGDAGTYFFSPYLDQDGAECVLVTNITTGNSKLYFYSVNSKSFELSPYQLPAKPTDDAGMYYCIPYLDQDGAECVFSYNSKTGKSVLWFYDSSTKTFLRSPYQLAEKPTGDAGEYHFRPYLDQDGAECVLAYNSKTGKSVLYFYDASIKAFSESPYQLPANPTNDSGIIGMQPYLDQDGAECVLVWNAITGSSVLYFYDASSQAFLEAPYQLTGLK